MVTNEMDNTFDDDGVSNRHRSLSISEPPRPARRRDEDDLDDDEEDLGVTPRRARRRPRVEHVSTPPMAASAVDDDDDLPRPRTRKPPAARKPGKGKKATKSKGPSRDRMASLPYEVAGIVLFAVDVLLTLSLLSYSSADNRPGHAVGNWIGPGGAFVADLLTIAFGAVAFLAPALLFVFVVACFRPVAQPRRFALRLVAGAFAGLCTMVLLHLMFRGGETFPFPAGGLIGAAVADTASKVLFPLGTGVVALAGLFVGGVVALDRPLGGTTRSIVDRVIDGWHHLTEQVAVWREERRLLAEEQARLVEEVQQPSTPPEDAGELERQRLQERQERLHARRLRISEKAEARARAKVQEAFGINEAQAMADADGDVGDGPTGDASLIPVAVPAQRRVLPTPIDTVPPTSTSSAQDGVVAAPEGTLEEQPTVVEDPPWAQDINEATVISLAEAIEKSRQSKLVGARKPIVSATSAPPFESPTMIVDEDLKIVEREDDTFDKVCEAEREDLEEKKIVKKKKEFVLPPLNLLDYDAPALEPIDQAKLRSQADKLISKFKDFGIEGRVREVRPGPVVTTYEFVPAPGIKVSKIAALADDIAMAMEAIHVRIVAPIPGKGAVGIEIPNEKRETVYMKEIIADPIFRKSEDKLRMALGKDIEGKSYYANLAEMPHVLVSGTTGSGKSVSVNAMICSILYRATPEDVRFMMIDPKMLELSLYDGIPHLLLPPIIDSKKAAVALKWCVAEMERRYQLLSDLGVRDIKGYNDKVLEALAPSEDPEVTKTPLFDKDGRQLEKMPFIVVIIDEYADLLAVAGKDVEGHVMRLAQKARAAGIHVMLATQRPSVDVITGVIKANFPVRMGFRLASNHDSKTIINQPGAEKLLGRGDMLFMPPGTSNVVRVHGAFVSEKELHRVVDFLKQQGTPDYDMSILTYQDDEDGDGMGGGSNEDFANEPKDARWDEALALVARTKKCSTSFVQRMLNIGYQRAARIVDRMEREGLVGPALNTKGDRDIYIKPDGSIDASERIMT